MATNFDGMSHEQIYQVVHAGAPAVVGGAAAELSDLNTTISGHLDVLDKLSQSMAEAWPDENGENFRATLSHTVGYLRELQATHVTTASSSITQVMSASHEKLSTTQATIPTPPAVPVAQQEANLNKEATANGGAMNQGMAMQSQNIAAAKANDAKAVTLAKGLANTYLAEKAKLTAPPAAPKGPSGSGSGSASPLGDAGSTSGTAAHGFAPPPSGGSPGSDPGSGTSGGAGAVGTVSPVTGSGHSGTTGGAGGNTGGVGTVGTVGGSGHDGDGGIGSGSGLGSAVGDGANHGGPGTGGPGAGGPGNLLDPSGGMAGGTGSTGTGGSGSGAGAGGFGGGVPGLLGGFGAASLGGLGGAGVVAARKAAAVRAAERAALLKQEEEAGVEGSASQGGASLTSSQLAAMNAQRNGVLAAGQEAGLMNSERNYMSMQQRTSSAAAMSAEEEASMAGGQRTVPGQLGGSPVATGSSTGARAPFTAGGVVGGAERVTWLVEDRDLWSADPGVRAVIDD